MLPLIKSGHTSAMALMKQKMNFDLYFMPYTKLKQIKDLNIVAKTIKHLEENMVVNICDLGLSKQCFLNNLSTSNQRKKYINGNSSKIKTFCSLKDTIKKLK